MADVTALSFDLVAKRIGTLSVPSATPATGVDPPGALHNDLITDTLYVVDGTSIVPLFRGSAYLTGTWRSKVIVRDDHPGFGWLRVNGVLDAPVTVRVYGDGTLRFTATALTTRTPVRMPPGRYREWEIEVESATRVADVVLATSVQELESA